VKAGQARPGQGREGHAKAGQGWERQGSAGHAEAEGQGSEF